VQVFWPVEELAELANGHTGYGGVGVCLEHRCDKVNCIKRSAED